MLIQKIHESEEHFVILTQALRIFSVSVFDENSLFMEQR